MCIHARVLLLPVRKAGEDADTGMLLGYLHAWLASQLQAQLVGRQEIFMDDSS